jgi:chaperonin GroES
MRDLLKLFEAPGGNVASLLDEEELAKIAITAVQGFDSDEESRSEWKERNNKGMKLAMQLVKQKNFPHENAANVMYPLISISAVQFNSRAYPNLIPGWDIVKGKVIGKDEDGLKAAAAERVSTHMNYQLNEQMEEWEEETDRLLLTLPILGCCFKKTYRSVVMDRNVSVFCSPADIVMHYKAKSMLTVPRITEKYNLYPNEMIERVRNGLFLDLDYGSAYTRKNEEDETDSSEEYSINDASRPHLWLEQHAFLDLDGDGYAEPYVINIHKDSQKVGRITPRFNFSDVKKNTKGQVSYIKPKKFYTKFPFIPSPDGSIYDWGFGSLLGPINNTVNTTVNQLLDAGTIANCQGGFLGKGVNLGRGKQGGPIQIGLNEWMPIAHSGDDLRKQIYPLPSGEPSLVLFQLLGFMVTAGEKLSSVTELLMGEQSVQNEPATTSLARLEQGLKVFSAIHKRLHKSFKNEFRLQYELNAEFTDPNYYYTILDDPVAKEVKQSDYDTETCNIIPTASPEDVSNTQKIMKSDVLMSMMGMGLNDQEIKKQRLEALQVPNIEVLLKAPEAPPDPKIVLESEKLDLERDKFEFELMKYEDEQIKIQSEIIKNLAEAEAKEIGPQIDMYKAQLEQLYKSREAKNANKSE